MIVLSQMLHTIDNTFKLNTKEVGEYRTIKVNGMKFTIWAYEAEGLGHVSAMHAEGFFGLMKMDTLIVTPTAVDMPLLSYVCRSANRIVHNCPTTILAVTGMIRSSCQKVCPRRGKSETQQPLPRRR